MRTKLHNLQPWLLRNPFSHFSIQSITRTLNQISVSVAEQFFNLSVRGEHLTKEIKTGNEWILCHQLPFLLPSSFTKQNFEKTRKWKDSTCSKQFTTKLILQYQGCYRNNPETFVCSPFPSTLHLCHFKKIIYFLLFLFFSLLIHLLGKRLFSKCLSQFLTLQCFNTLANSNSLSNSCALFTSYFCFSMYFWWFLAISFNFKSCHSQLTSIMVKG